MSVTTTLDDAGEIDTRLTVQILTVIWEVAVAPALSVTEYLMTVLPAAVADGVTVTLLPLTVAVHSAGMSAALSTGTRASPSGSE